MKNFIIAIVTILVLSGVVIAEDDMIYFEGSSTYEMATLVFFEPAKDITFDAGSLSINIPIEDIVYWDQEELVKLGALIAIMTNVTLHYEDLESLIVEMLPGRYSGGK